MKDQENIVGYAGLEIHEDCYEYFENECCIADTIESAENMMKESYSCVGPYKVTPVTMLDIMNDFGCSCGSYAFGIEAFARFENLATKSAINFSSRLESATDSPLMIVKVSGVKINNG